jgi:hypothetical protein
MADIVWVTLLGHLILPIGIIAWIAAGRCTSSLELGLKVLAAATYGCLLAVAGVWLLLPRSLLWGYAVAAGIATWHARRCLRTKPDLGDTSARRWRLASQATVSAVCLAVTATALRGYAPPAPPAEPVRLSSPLAKGLYSTWNGGYSILINPHMKALHRPELSNFRGQSYAVDLVKVDEWGRRAVGIMPETLEDYFIFGQPVYAPCSGEVARTENALPDRKPVESGQRTPAGNFVLLECGGRQVLLAHLMEGSVGVEAGETVHTGQPLGRVGNSGYSTEPHLHLHAQAPSAAADVDADPLPLQVNGQTLVRGSRLDSPGPASEATATLP